MNNDASFNIFEKLREWSTELDNWHRLALLKLLEKDCLDESDISAIYEEFKIEKGLLDPPVTRITYDLNGSSIPQPSSPAQSIFLCQIKDVKGVNAITEGQELNCGPSLTVIYGPNGSGKSGYARILKSACFTRSSDIDIHGNVNIPIAQRPQITATFMFSDTTSVPFVQGSPCPQLRDNFAVFDSSCIRVCIDDKNEFMVNPYGFNVFQGLVDVIAKVKNSLEEEIGRRLPNLLVLRIDGSSSEVATLLNNLSKDIDLLDLKRLGKFWDEEKVRLVELSTKLEELTRKDKSDLLREKRIIGKDIKLVMGKLKSVMVLTKSDAYTKVCEALKNLKKLRDIAIAASAAQFSKEPVQPVGTEAWRALIEAAIQYNVEVCPGQAFPNTSEDVRCLLCHQPLDKTAKERLKKFFIFIQGEAESNLRNSLEEVRRLKQSLEVIDLHFFREDISGYRAVANCDSSLVEQITTYTNTARGIRDSLVKNLQSGEWEAVSELPESPVLLCRSLREKLAREIRMLRKQDISKEKEALEVELQLLRDRQRLSQIITSVEEAVINLKWIDKSHEPKRSLTPQRVTVKQKALTNELMGKGFKGRFEKELEFLEIGSLPVKVNITGAEAVTRRNLAVGKDDVSPPEPSKVLSEGEQTVVALADFLTEINLNEAPIGIIFDDPVNSMDHIRKEKIANRLVIEACKRQVIIFTHDVLFTHHLAEEAAKLGADKVQFKACTVSVGVDKAPGYIDKMTFPYVHYEKESEKLAEAYLNEAKQLSGDAQTEKLELGCGALRATYEDFIQQHIFNDVVRRWREPIKAIALAQVYLCEEINDIIVEQYERLSRYEKGHSHTPEFHEVPLNISILEEAIRIFRETKKRFNQEADKYKKIKSEAKKKVFS